MDFDDLLASHRRAVPASTPTCWPHYQQRFQHVLVDEYQDTNRAQNELVLLLAARAPQRLRRGRQRPVDLRVPGRRHPQHPRVRGGLPRRHGGRARAELPVDPDHPRRRQRRHRQQRRPQAQGAVDRARAAGEPIVRYHADDEGDEAQWVADRAARLHDEGDYRWGDIAVFYRTNAQSRVHRGAPDAGRHPLQGRRRHPLLRPARGQGRPGLPEGRGQPGRRGRGQAGPQRAQAGRRRHHHRPARRLGQRATA